MQTYVFNVQATGHEVSLWDKGPQKWDKRKVPPPRDLFYRYLHHNLFKKEVEHAFHLFFLITTKNQHALNVRLYIPSIRYARFIRDPHI
jgi:hypothetical protein